jgi:hypothetical protein
MSKVFLDNNFAVLSGTNSATVFIKPSAKVADSQSTIANLEEILNENKIVPWGENNQFPQFIIDELKACGIAIFGLGTKARSLYGGGLLYGTRNAEGVFTQSVKGQWPEVDKFWKDNNKLTRFYSEFFTDWVYYANCFPELLLSLDGKKINKLAHQESTDCRIVAKGSAIAKIAISKYWSNPNKILPNLEKDSVNNSFKKPKVNLNSLDKKYVSFVNAIDMYNPLESTQELAIKGHRNLILPVNYPSPGKTFYQLSEWDATRHAGWINIASNIPSLAKAYYENAFHIKYHIEIPEDYFVKKVGEEKWIEMDAEAKKKVKQSLLETMTEFLAGSENAWKSFVSYFDINKITGEAIPSIKISVIENKNSVEKDLLNSGTANREILIAMGINPNMIGAGQSGGGYSSNQGGSNIREGKLVMDANLALDRELALEPLYLIKQFNQWPDDVEFAFKDTILTTLDTGAGAKQVTN